MNLAKLITAHGRRVEIPPEMLRRMYEAVDLKIPDADETLVRLKGSLASDAYNDEDASGLRRHFGASSEGMALLILERVANAGPSSIYVPFDSEKAAVTALDALVAKGVPVALRIKGFALRRGKIYRQDDVEATKHLIKAAEAGDALAMKLVADAYSSGTGVGENRAEEWRWLKAAAKAGNVEAQSHLINLMTFRRHYPGYNVHDAFLQSVVLAAEDDSPFGVLSGLSRVIDREDIESLGVEYLAASVMDGFRASMAARNDTVMVRIFKSTPDPVRRGVEEILKRDGFLSAEPDGFMGPAARTALASWARSKGLPEIESDRPPAPPEADARMTGVPIIPPEVLKALRVKAFNGANKAKGKDDIKAPMQMLALLAQYGDMVPRLELLKNYSGVRAVRDAVPPGLAALYGFDVLISRPPGSEKAPVDFVFAVTHMAQNGSLPIAAEAFLYTLRDDPRLRQIEIFDSVVDRFIFVPDYCDHIRQAASKAKVGGLDSDGCSGASRRALLAWAKAAGPMGVEAQLRREAAEAILKAPK